MSKQTTKSVGSLNELLPEFTDYFNLSQTYRYELENSIPSNGWKTILRQDSASKKFQTGWTDEEQDAITQGRMVCPACLGEGRYGLVETAVAYLGNDKTMPVVRERRHKCVCQKWKHIWKITKRSIPSQYHYVNLNLLTANSQNRLPMEVQEEEIKYVRQHRNESFLFLGPSGTGKTTMSNALLRYAFERRGNARFFWKEDGLGGYGLDYPNSRWLWRINFEALLRQTNAKNKETWGGDQIDDPEVSVAKIYKAKEQNHRPVLILEEIDKLELNLFRINFLNAIIDALYESGGQLIVTSNLNLPDLVKSMRAVEGANKADPVIRRLIYNVNIRNYFIHCSDD